MGQQEDELKKAFTSLIQQLNCDLADKLHISYDEMMKIMADNLLVKRVVFQKRSRFSFLTNTNCWKESIKHVGFAAMAVLLVLFLSVQGMADSIRESILRIITGQRAVHVESIVYDRYDDLHGYIVPSSMPAGYEPDYYTTTENMLYISYINDAGEQIQYYYYPQGASASYDNERAKHHVISSKFGQSHVWCAENGRTTVYLLIESAYVQMDFDGAMTDAEIKQVIDGLSRVQ